METSTAPYRCRRQWISGSGTRASAPYLCRTEVPVAVGVAAMTRPRFRAYPVKGPRTEAGAALLAFLLILLIGGSYALLRDAKSLAQRAKLEESRKTSEALAEAKAALIGYAVSRQIDPNCTAPGNNCPRPGDLPCPDINNDGEIPATGTGSSCGNASGSSGQASRLARLPWRTLDLGDLRDGAGERLWYAVSATFKANTRSTCTSPASSGCLNSDTRGRITVKVAGGDTDGDGAPDDVKVLHDGRNPDWRNTAERVNPAAQWAPSGALAVLIAPGKPLNRQDGITQNRGGACETASTTSCARNYLDVGLGEDNAIFYDGPTLSNRGNGFIAGDILGNCDDGDCDVIVNDRILPITYQDIIPLLEKRVVAEILACLSSYSSYIDPDSGDNPNKKRYPWAANRGDLSSPYEDTDGERFGRVPDPPFTATSVAGMHNRWTDSCLMARFKYDDVLDCNNPLDPPRFDDPGCYRQAWWRNWKELVFYAVAQKYQPDTVVPVEEPPPSPAPPTPPCGTPPCLAVNQSAANGDKRVIVVAAGKRLQQVAGGQPRSTVTDKGDINNYLEGENASPGDDIYELQSVPTGFNDVVCREGLCP